MARNDASEEYRSQVQKLDGILPDSINRRNFLKSVATATVLPSAAGCVGGDNSNGDSGGGTTAGDNVIQNNVVYRNPWKPNLSYAAAYISELEGMWNDQDITPPVVREGFGSGDTVNRVGNGQEMLGMASINPQISSFSEELDFKMFGVAKQRNSFGLIYNSNKLDSYDDISEDTRVVATSGLAEMTWNIYKSQLDLPDVNLEVIDSSAAMVEFEEGSADAMWRGAYQFEYAQDRVGDQFEVDAKFLTDVVPIFGFTQIVYEPWLQDNFEYVTRVLEGFSHALKWVSLNPEETVQIMRNDVNQALQTGDKAVQLATLRAGYIANNMTEVVRDNGLGYIDTDRVETTLEVVAPEVGLDTVPAVDDLVELGPQEEAELATFSDDEWEQVMEYAQPYVDLYGY